METLPIFMGLAAIADPFVVVAFGDKFAPSAEFMSISAFTMFPAVIGWFLPNLLISRAETKEAFKLTLVNVTSNVLIAGTTVWFGIEVMLISVVAMNFLMLPVRFGIVMKYIHIDIWKLISALFSPFTCALGMFFIVSGSKIFLGDFIENDLAMLGMLLIIGGLAYPLLAFGLFYKNTLVQLKELNEMFSKKRVKN